MTAEPASFDEVQERIQSAYQRGDYAAALKLAERHAPRFPERSTLFNYWRICMNARLERTPLSIQLLEEVLENGVWYGEVLLRKSPSLKGLQGLPEFERLVALNRQLQAEDQGERLPLIVLRSQGCCAQGQDPCPLLLALHSNASTAQDSLPLWQPAASAGWLVAAPQSSQAMWKGAYVWNDFEIAHQEVRHHYDAMVRQYAVDAQRVVLAGHSMGGETAISLALSGDIPAAGFLAIGPGGPNMDQIENWGPLIDAARRRLESSGAPFSGALIAGEADPSISLDGIYNLAAMLTQAGITCRVETVPGAGHDDHAAYQPAALRALESIPSSS